MEDRKFTFTNYAERELLQGNNKATNKYTPKKADNPDTLFSSTPIYIREGKQALSETRIPRLIRSVKDKELPISMGAVGDASSKPKKSFKDCKNDFTRQTLDDLKAATGQKVAKNFVATENVAHDEIPTTAHFKHIMEEFKRFKVEKTESIAGPTEAENAALDVSYTATSLSAEKVALANNFTSTQTVPTFLTSAAAQSTPATSSQASVFSNTVPLSEWTVESIKHPSSISTLTLPPLEATSRTRLSSTLTADISSQAVLAFSELDSQNRVTFSDSTSQTNLSSAWTADSSSQTVVASSESASQTAVASRDSSSQTAFSPAFTAEFSTQTFVPIANKFSQTVVTSLQSSTQTNLSSALTVNSSTQAVVASSESASQTAVFSSDSSSQTALVSQVSSTQTVPFPTTVEATSQTKPTLEWTAESFAQAAVSSMGSSSQTVSTPKTCQRCRFARKFCRYLMIGFLVTASFTTGIKVDLVELIDVDAIARRIPSFIFGTAEDEPTQSN